MSTPHQPQVVVGFDFSHSGRAALERAIALATRAPFHVLHFVCVIDPHRPMPFLPSKGGVDYQYAQRVQEAITAEVAAALEAADASERVHFSVHARIGKPAKEILMTARDVGADLIIVGSKGLTGLERLVLGSVAEAVVREAGCTVEVARAKTYANVELLEIGDAVEPPHPYVPPHRYTYENRSLVRPTEWPLY